MTEIAIINFTGFRGNWGCQATSFELLKFVAGLFPEDRGLRITPVPLLPLGRIDIALDAELDRIFGAFTAVATGSDRAASSLAWLEATALRRYGHWAETVRRADLVVFQAEGAMGQGADFARGPRLMLLPFVAKHAWGRRVISLNQSFYAQDERILRNAAETFSTLDFTAFREGASVAFARANGVPEAAFVPDLAFLTRPSGTMRLPDLMAAPGYFAVSGSALKDPDRFRLILDQADAIREATGLRPLIALSRDNRMKLMARWRWWRSGYAAIPDRATYTNVTKMLSQCAFLIGGRYHMAIMAAAAGTPNIFLTGNSFKNDGLAALLGGSRSVRDFGDTRAILADARAIVAGGAGERAQVVARTDEIRAVIARAGDHLRDLLYGGAPGRFEDGLEPFQYSQALLDRYRRFGGAKTKRKLTARLRTGMGGRERISELVEPIREGLQGDREATSATLRRLALGDPAIADYLSGTE